METFTSESVFIQRLVILQYRSNQRIQLATNPFPNFHHNNAGKRPQCASAGFPIPEKHQNRKTEHEKRRSWLKTTKIVKIGKTTQNKTQTAP